MQNSNRVSIQFLGAASTVTGSKHLLKAGEKNILIDCGLFQGLKSLRLKNREMLPVDAGTIDVMLLTHAHLDHCGYIPLLVKQGFKGKIMMTSPTRDLAEVILRDSAKIQEEDAQKANQYGFSKHDPALPLYTLHDVEQALKEFEVHPDEVWISLFQDIEFRFMKNGHIIGSSFIDMKCFGKRIVFSGDVGRMNSELMSPPVALKEADFLIMESTYGDRLHPSVLSKDELADVINDTVHAKGNLLIPSFAVGRAQELMLLISELKNEIRIPDIPVYMDSPMGADATDILRKYPDWHKLSEKQCHDVFQNIRIIREFSETLDVINRKGSQIVIAASGMLSGGRVLEYLKHYIGDKKNMILLAGYQAEGTRGRALKEGAHEIKMHGKYFRVVAGIREITSLSAHADQKEMLDWMKGFNPVPKKIILVHGEVQTLNVFRVKIVDELKTEVIIPKQDEEFVLFDF